MKKIGLIKNEEEYKNALDELEKLMHANIAGEKVDMERYTLLGLVVKHYENEHFPYDEPDPLALIDFILEQQGRDRNYLGREIGRNRVSEIFRGKRKISPRIAVKLHDELHVPGDVLIRAMA